MVNKFHMGVRVACVLTASQFCITSVAVAGEMMSTMAQPASSQAADHYQASVPPTLNIRRTGKRRIVREQVPTLQNTELPTRLNSSARTNGQLSHSDYAQALSTDRPGMVRLYAGPKAYGKVVKPVQVQFTIRNYYKP